mmetsp:Transcript_65896/g.157539  ORF Transcript_65896/g.157539 Transcript_65896/m.157539 type:complete len:530 (-) Transcript_65896:59-1648(-)
MPAQSGSAGQQCSDAAPKTPSSCVSEALETIGFGRFQVMVLLLTGGVMFAEGAEMLVMGSITALLHEHWDLHPALRGAMVSIVFVGFSVGNFFSGQIGDRWGRRKAVLLSYLLIGIFGFWTASSSSPSMMITLRFMVGLGCGIGFPAVYSLIPEVCPSTARGSTCTVMIGFMPLGEVYAACGVLLYDRDLDGSTRHCDTGAYYPTRGLMEPDHCSWKALCEYSALPALIFFLVSFAALPESPYFLAERGRVTELEGILMQMAEANGKEVDLAPLRASLAAGVAPSSSIVSSPSKEPSSPESVPAYSFMAVLRTLLGDTFMQTTLFLCLAHYVKDFSVFGLAYSLPQYFSFMEHLTVGLQLVTMATLAIPGVILSILLTRVQWVGHIKCMACSAAVCCVFSLGMLEFAPDTLSTLSAYVVKAVALTYFIVTVVYTTEVFPTSMRNTAVGLCTCAGRLGSISAPLLFEMSLHHGRSSDAFMWMLCILMGIVAVGAPLSLKRETKAQSLDSASEAIGPAAAAATSSKYGSVA